MQLGGNIELEGFDSLEPALLVVVKKMVGSEAKKISENGIAFDKLRICLESNNPTSCAVSGSIVVQGNDVSASVSENNLFFGIDRLFKKLVSSLKH